LQDADAAVVRAREAAVKEQQSTPEYIADVKAVDDAYQAFIDKKNALVADMEKKDPVYNQMKAQVSAVDAQIDAARQNPGTTQERFDELYKNRETFVQQWHQLEKDASDRAGLTPLWQHWVDASKKLADLQSKLSPQIENNDRLKAAIAMAEDAKNAVQQAKVALGGSAGSTKLTDAEQTHAGDFLCRYSQTGFAGNDAWWTYGWSTIDGGEKSVGNSTSNPNASRGTLPSSWMAMADGPCVAD
jgi:uncharacterized membrane-anchored protein YhcB (DUF1043 family)